MPCRSAGPAIGTNATSHCAVAKTSSARISACLSISARRIQRRRPRLDAGSGCCRSQSVHIASTSSLAAWAVVRLPCAWSRARIAPRRAGLAGGDGLGDVRCHRSGGKAASASNACDGGHGEKTAPRRIYGRVCGWHAKHAVSLDHGIYPPRGSG